MTSPAHRDSVLDVIGFLSGVELGDKAGADIIAERIKAVGVYAVIEAMTLVSRQLATDLANRERVDRLEIYRRLATIYLEDCHREG
jgi:hypothetical protein